MTSRGHQLGEPALLVFQRRDVFEAPVGEGRAVPAFGVGLPADGAVESVVVVVEREAGQCLLGGCGRGAYSEPRRRANLPFVQGELTYVRMCLMRCPASVLPRSASTSGIRIARDCRLIPTMRDARSDGTPSEISRANASSLVSSGSDPRRPIRNSLVLGCCEIHEIPAPRFATKWRHFRLAHPSSRWLYKVQLAQEDHRHVV
jgi:hypothetical protein